MPHRFLQSELADAMGFTTMVSSIGLAIGDWLDITNVNDWLQFFVTLGGIVWLWFKIKNSRLDAKIKKKILDKDA